MTEPRPSIRGIKEQRLARPIEYIQRVFPEQQMSSPEGVQAFFESTGADDLLKFFERFYRMNFGLSREIADEDISEADIKTNGSLDVVYMLASEFPKFFSHYYERLQQMAIDDIDGNQEAIARAMSILISFGHPIPDGNGRLSRLAYRVFSPNISDKSADSLMESSSRPEAMLSAIHEMYDTTLSVMARQRGVDAMPLSQPSDRYEYCVKCDWARIAGLDQTALSFMRAADLVARDGGHISEYIHQEGEMWVLDFNVLPAVIQEEFKHANDLKLTGKDLGIRVQFASTAAEIAIARPDLFDHYFDALQINTDEKQTETV